VNNYEYWGGRSERQRSHPLTYSGGAKQFKMGTVPRNHSTLEIHHQKVIQTGKKGEGGGLTQGEGSLGFPLIVHTRKYERRGPQTRRKGFFQR